ncbi:Rpp14/Pop5 family-domain-containing protein [Apodospora peruviana]|uniref:Ribonuclease P/MRP protein subunit POP5 n=1 Tax=Apodospora peruviana TaxID=516989 RepID=A0AAE0I4V7_9PEZI|nr:Rpp14/Pop5 family-domain-containing protein [Apodospora peruviana]
MVRLKDRYLLVTIIYSDVPAGGGVVQPNKDGAAGAVSDLLLFNQPTTNELRPQMLLKGIRSQVASLFGDCGSGAVDRSLQVKYLSPATSTFILRVSRAQYRLVWAALSFMNRLPMRDGRPCIFRVVRVSGTIRKVEEEAVRRAKLLILAAEEEMTTGTTTTSAGALDALFRSDAGGKDRHDRSLATLQTQEDDHDDDNNDAMEVENDEMLSDG